ncbi:MAG: class B sortase [Lachnospiraceae bacterium]|nr:class B sortase [Lachnospiraceae bacterium]MCR5086703.1 class B sortase [Lachnospiraceae bacterium]
MGYQSWEQMERRKKIRRVIWIVLLLLFLCSAAYCGYHFYCKWKEGKQQQNYEDLHNRAFTTPSATPTDVPSTATPTPTHAPTQEELLYKALRAEYADFFTIQPDFDILRSENEDIFAYIAIPGTIVDYPILSHEVEDYYLDHNLDHSKGYPGCLYIQNCNDESLDDAVTIVYGHNMKNGTMFGSLKDYNDAEFLGTHPYFFVYGEHRVMVYEIVIVSHISEEHLFSDDYVKRDGKWVFTEFDGYETARMLERVRKEDGDRAYIAAPEPTAEDNLMVLSTCGEGRRFIIVGKRVLDIPRDFQHDDNTDGAE